MCRQVRWWKHLHIWPMILRKKIYCKDTENELKSYHNKRKWANFVRMQDSWLLLKSDSTSRRKTLKNSHNSQIQWQYTLSRDEDSSDPKGWIRGNTKIGPVLEVTTSYLQGKYGVEILTESVNKVNSHSWIRISHDLNKLVTDLSNNKEDDNNEQETSEMQFENFPSKTNALAFISPPKAKARPLLPAHPKELSPSGKKVDLCWTRRLFVYRLPSVKTAQYSSLSWSSTSRRWWSDWILEMKGLSSVRTCAPSTLIWWKMVEYNDRVFFTPVDPTNKDHKDPDVIDLEAPRLAWYKQETWKKHQNMVYWVDIKLAQRKGFKFYQTRSNVIILHDTLPAYCIPKAIMMESGEIIYENVYESPRPPPKISFNDNWMKELDSEVAGGKKDSQQIHSKTKHPIVKTGRPVLSEQPLGSFTQCEDIDFRVSGLSHAVVKQAQNFRVRELVKKIESHPHRRPLQADLQQNNAYNPFSVESKVMIRDMDNVELFELCETIPKVQCSECILHWKQGIVYCTCGHLLKESETSQHFHQWRLDAFSIENYVIKKERPRGARHGKTEVQKEHFIAHNARRRCLKKKFEGIHDCSIKDSTYRDSQLKIGCTEETCIAMDKLAKENHFYCWRVERYRENWYISLKKSGRNAPMKLRSDFREALTNMHRLHCESGEERPEPIPHYRHQRRHSSSSSSSASRWHWNEHWSRS